MLNEIADFKLDKKVWKSSEWVYKVAQIWQIIESAIKSW